MSSSAARSDVKVIGNKDRTEYQDRVAVRLIVHRKDGKLAIISVAKGNYLKLPGGGIEGNEEHRQAAEREALEETGCRVEVHGECVGICEEWRNDLHQLSYCYTATMVEDTGKPELTEVEASEGLKHQWLSLSDAIKNMQASEPTSELGRFIRERDLYFLEQFQSWGILV